MTNPGDILEEIFARAGIKKTKNCGCAEMKAKMNEWGWRGCLLRTPVIVAWLMKKSPEVSGSQIGRILREVVNEYSGKRD